MTSTDPTPRRPLRPMHIAFIVVLIGAVAAFAYLASQMAATAVGKGPPSTRSAMRTTPSEAEANSQGQGRQGSNASQDSYVTQNQSRPPEAERR